MFRDLKEYQDITKIYQNNVYQSEEDIIKEAFASEEFTEEEAAFIEENFDAVSYTHLTLPTKRIV